MIEGFWTLLNIVPGLWDFFAAIAYTILDMARSVVEMNRHFFTSLRGILHEINNRRWEKDNRHWSEDDYPWGYPSHSFDPLPSPLGPLDWQLEWCSNWLLPLIAGGLIFWGGMGMYAYLDDTSGVNHPSAVLHAWVAHLHAWLLHRIPLFRQMHSENEYLREQVATLVANLERMDRRVAVLSANNRRLHSQLDQMGVPKEMEVDETDEEGEVGVWGAGEWERAGGRRYGTEELKAAMWDDRA